MDWRHRFPGQQRRQQISIPIWLRIFPKRIWTVVRNFPAMGEVPGSTDYRLTCFWIRPPYRVIRFGSSKNILWISFEPNPVFWKPGSEYFILLLIHLVTIYLNYSIIYYIDNSHRVHYCDCNITPSDFYGDGLWGKNDDENFLNLGINFEEIKHYWIIEIRYYYHIYQVSINFM